MKPYRSHKEETEDAEVRRGPWTLEEDNLLTRYITLHGEGRWNSLAKSAGLKRTGKSCRLRWLNYLKPDIKRGNLTPQEQLMILELHSKIGNRWSKIAQHLPGRTDNEIKNYWRTRVQKQAKQLNMESNSQGFVDAIKCFYMPRLAEKIEQNCLSSTSMNYQASSSTTTPEMGAGSADQAYKDCYSSFSSSESSKGLNPVEITGNQSYPDGYFHQDFHQSRDYSALSSETWSNYLENSNSDQQAFPVNSATRQCSDVHMADQNWISSDMADDLWNLNGFW